MAGELHQRLDNVFGALDQHDPHSSAPTWSITDRVVQNRGQDPPDSESEDEQEHQECIQVLCDVEEEGGGGLGPEQLPSSSACRAFEKEEEEDEFDRLACESLQRLRCRPKPALKTQVAERNIYDRMMIGHGVTSPRSPTSSTSPHAQPKTDRKKVRFRETDEFPEDSPATTSQTAVVKSHCSTPLQGPSPRVRRRLLEGDQAVLASPASGPVGTAALPSWQSTMLQSAQQQPLQPKAPGQGLPTPSNPRSYVPEHVRRPAAFTCYALDVPVVVGSGHDGNSASSAASAASAAVEYLPPSTTAAVGPAAAATDPLPELEPGAVKFMAPSPREDSRSRNTSVAMISDDHADVGEGRCRDAPAAHRAVAAVDSDMEDAFDGMDDAEIVPAAVSNAGGGAGVPGAQGSCAAAVMATEHAAATGLAPAGEGAGAFFVEKSGRRAGRKMRARTTNDD